MNHSSQPTDQDVLARFRELLGFSDPSEQPDFPLPNPDDPAVRTALPSMELHEFPLAVAVPEFILACWSTSNLPDLEELVDALKPLDPPHSFMLQKAADGSPALYIVRE